MQQQKLRAKELQSHVATDHGSHRAMQKQGAIEPIKEPESHAATEQGSQTKSQGAKEPCSNRNREPNKEPGR